jgi:phospholipid transport system transporter-binding protein
VNARARIEVAADGASVSGPMTMENAAALLAQGRAVLAQGATTFDLAAVTEVDSSGLAVLFGWQRAAQAQGRSIAVRNPPHNLRSLAGVYDVAGLLALP